MTCSATGSINSIRAYNGAARLEAIRIKSGLEESDSLNNCSVDLILLTNHLWISSKYLIMESDCHPMEHSNSKQAVD